MPYEPCNCYGEFYCHGKCEKAAQRNSPEQEAANATHPGFTITCDKCGSERVYVDNSFGCSFPSGAWGSVDLICHDCNASCVLMDTD